MRTKLGGILLLAVFAYPLHVEAEVIDVTLRISTDGEEATVTRENLITIQQFIIGRGQRETYSNRFSNNPAFRTDNYAFYLNPDTGQENASCDLEKSGFHQLTIRRTHGGRDQYRQVEFLSEHDTYVRTAWPTDDLTVARIRQFVVDAMEELLALIEAERTASEP